MMVAMICPSNGTKTITRNSNELNIHPFFFQAEDGIRRDLVTGVQTCALPICRYPDAPLPRPDERPQHRQRDQRRGGRGADDGDGTALPAGAALLPPQGPPAGAGPRRRLRPDRKSVV